MLQIASATSPRVRGLFSGRDTCKPSLREAEHLHTSSRLKCHLFEGRSLGATHANPAFGKPITFTDSQGNIAIRLSAVLWARDVQTQPSGSRTPHSPFSYDNRGQRAAVACTTALPLVSVEFHFARHDNCRQSAAEQRPSTILATAHSSTNTVSLTTQRHLHRGVKSTTHSCRYTTN